MGVFSSRLGAFAGGLVSIVGVALLIDQLGHAMIEPPIGLAYLLGIVVPGLLSLVIVAVGVWIAFSDLEDRDATYVVGWALFCGLVAAGFGITTIIYEGAHGVTIVHARHVVANTLTGGVVGGLLIAFFHVRSLRRADELEAEREVLEEQREKLEVLTRILRHDIRNDLNVALGNVDLAATEADASTRDYLERGERALTNSLYLTESAGEVVERIGGNTDESELHPVDLREALGKQLAGVRESYPEATLVADDVPEAAVLADDMLSSVFRNLLTNAIQHNSADEPTVELAVEENEDRIVVRVADDGPGVPDDRKEEIFGRGEKGLESEGSGIGLYLVDTLVEEYGGDVWVTDDEPTGSTFHVELRPVGEHGESADDPDQSSPRARSKVSRASSRRSA